MLEANASGLHKDPMTLTRIADLLRREGYDGGYDAPRRHAGRWADQRRDVDSPVEAFTGFILFKRPVLVGKWTSVRGRGDVGAL